MVTVGDASLAFLEKIHCAPVPSPESINGKESNVCDLLMDMKTGPIYVMSSTRQVSNDTEYDRERSIVLVCRGATTFSKLWGSNSLVSVIVQNKIRMVYPVSCNYCSLLRNGNHTLHQKVGVVCPNFGGPDPQWLRPCWCDVLLTGVSIQRCTVCDALVTESAAAANDVVTDAAAVQQCAPTI